MAVELVVPTVGESITEVQIGDWLVPEGQRATKEEALVVIETDKVTVELPAPISGTVTRVLKKKGETAAVGEVIGYIDETANGAGSSAKPGAGDKSRSSSDTKPRASPDKAARAPADTAPTSAPKASNASKTSEPRVMPSAARALAQANLSVDDVEATGPGGRVLKEDVQRRVERGGAQRAPENTDENASEPQSASAASSAPPIANAPSARSAAPPRSAPSIGRPVLTSASTSAAGSSDARAASSAAGREEEVVPMTPMRRRIAARLVEAQNTAALLTTFNEIDMSAVIALRNEHKESFQARHGVKLGFMSFFVKAAIDALKLVPQMNAEISGESIVYHNYYDIGVAVGGGKGLVVPVLRNAERMSFAEVEAAIGELASRAQANKLTLDELQGGTFTISNGGIYGSLLSTPIVNPPQSGILGLHAIQERPIAHGGQVLVRPMMYVAVTYDHRLVDGREAVTFLKRIKECVENPSRMLLEI
jgi:2-oxoglutarate dehydrogenase E2 component (dihydrolipoamide succinyltransferase)